MRLMTIKLWYHLNPVTPTGKNFGTIFLSCRYLATIIGKVSTDLRYLCISNMSLSNISMGK